MNINLSNKNLTKNAKKLRKNMTKEEKHLWYDCLKNMPAKFTRQKVIGNFIVDFCCEHPKIIIELDGDQHYSSDESIQKDVKRDRLLEKMGYKVLRYQNIQIHENFRGIGDEIFAAIDSLKD